MEQRYIQNQDDIFTEDLQNRLLVKTISIIGCGGQGGYIAEFVSRLGVKAIYLWDGDRYERSNLNRQIGCLENNIGEYKSSAIQNRIQLINSEINIKSFQWFFGENEQDLKYLYQSDFIFLSFDDSQNVKYTRELIKKAILKGVPAIDCPNNLLGGFISINTKKDLSHYDLYTEILDNQKQKERQYGYSTSYKCALIAAEAVNCMVQYFNQDRFAPIDSKLEIDIYHHKYYQSDKYGIF